MPYLLATLRRTLRFSLGVPCWLTRESAFLACDRSWIGYWRFSGIAKLLLLIRFLPLAVSLAIVTSPSVSISGSLASLLEAHSLLFLMPASKLALLWFSPFGHVGTTLNIRKIRIISTMTMIARPMARSMFIRILLAISHIRLERIEHIMGHAQGFHIIQAG